jgi:hypothetical protein
MANLPVSHPEARGGAGQQENLRPAQFYFPVGEIDNKLSFVCEQYEIVSILSGK